MLIAELRGSIVTIRAEKLSVSYLDQIQESKKETNKTISDVLHLVSMNLYLSSLS